MPRALWQLKLQLVPTFLLVFSLNSSFYCQTPATPHLLHTLLFICSYSSCYYRLLVINPWQHFVVLNGCLSVRQYSTHLAASVPLVVQLCAWSSQLQLYCCSYSLLQLLLLVFCSHIEGVENLLPPLLQVVKSDLLELLWWLPHKKWVVIHVYLCVPMCVATCLAFTFLLKLLLLWMLIAYFYVSPNLL